MGGPAGARLRLTARIGLLASGVLVWAVGVAACGHPEPAATGLRERVAGRATAPTRPSPSGSAPLPTTGLPGARAPGAPPGASALGLEGIPAFRHVFVVVMENLEAQAAMALPDIQALARRYAAAPDWFAAAHPSLPNYLELVAGTTFGIRSDCTACFVEGPELLDQLEAAGISYDAYFEGMPSPCFLGPEVDDTYAGKHDPFRYFVALRSSPEQCAHLRPFAELGPLLHGPASEVPRFVWVTPNLCDDGHDCPPTVAAAWLRGFVAQVTASAAWRQGGVLFVTWDEGNGADTRGLDPLTGRVEDGIGGGQVLTLVIAPDVPQGLVVDTPYTHASLLRTIEDAFGLAHLGEAADPGVRPLSAFFDATTAIQAPARQ